MGAVECIHKTRSPSTLFSHSQCVVGNRFTRVIMSILAPSSRSLAHATMLLLTRLCSQPRPSKQEYTKILSKGDFIKVASEDAGAPRPHSPPINTSAGLTLENPRILYKLQLVYIFDVHYNFFLWFFAWLTGKEDAISEPFETECSTERLHKFSRCISVSC